MWFLALSSGQYQVRFLLLSQDSEPTEVLQTLGLGYSGLAFQLCSLLPPYPDLLHPHPIQHWPSLTLLISWMSLSNMLALLGAILWTPPLPVHYCTLYRCPPQPPVSMTPKPRMCL